MESVSIVPGYGLSEPPKAAVLVLPQTLISKLRKEAATT